MSTKRKKPAKPKFGYTNPVPIPEGSIMMIDGKLYRAGKSGKGTRTILGFTKREIKRLTRMTQGIMLNWEAPIIRP